MWSDKCWESLANSFHPRSWSTFWPGAKYLTHLDSSLVLIQACPQFRPSTLSQAPMSGLLWLHDLGYPDHNDLGIACSNWMPELHFSCHTGSIIQQKGWRWDLSPQTVQRGQGTRHQLCHPPFSQGHRHHMVWLAPSRGPRICIRARPILEICTPRNHFVDLWHFLWKVKTWIPWKLEKSRSGWRNSIDPHLCRCAKVPGLATAAGFLLLALLALAAKGPINNCIKKGHSNPRLGANSPNKWTKRTIFTIYIPPI